MGTPSIPLRSNVVEFHVVKADPEWQGEQLAAEGALEAQEIKGTGIPPNTSCRTFGVVLSRLPRCRNTARGLTKSYGERLRGCNPRNLNPEKAQGLSPELQAALEPLLAAIESLSERIHEYKQQIEKDLQGKLPASGAAGTGEGRGNADRASYMLTLGSASFSQEPRRGLLCGTATGTAKPGSKRTAPTHQQGR
jgi:hypothetical protein